jgi:hypothetical protein
MSAASSSSSSQSDLTRQLKLANFTERYAIEAGEHDDTHDPTQICAIPRGHVTFTSSECHEYKCRPKYHIVDLFGEKQAGKLNNDEPYHDVMAKGCNYVVKVPWDPFIHFDHKEQVLIFQTDESTDLTAFVWQHVSTATSLPSPVRMFLSKEQASFSLSETVANSNGYQLMPVKIEVVLARSTIPINFSLNFYSTTRKTPVATNALSMADTSWHAWNTVAKSHNQLGSAHSGQPSGYPLLSNASTVSQEFKTLYWPTPVDKVNSADFSRYIACDFTALRQGFDQLDQQVVMGVKCYVIRLPSTALEDIGEENKRNVVLVFIMNHHQELMRRTAAFCLEREREANMYCSLLRDSMSTSPVYYLPTDVSTRYINQLREEYPMSQYLMCARHFKVEAVPIAGAKGWQDLQKIAEARAPVSGFNDNLAQMTVGIRIVYHEFYDQRLKLKHSGGR